MKATSFESKHQNLLHLLLVGLALLTYFRDRVDIVWALIRSHPDRTLLEHTVFGVGALLLLGSAMLETWSHAHPRFRSSHPLPWPRILLVLAVGLLLPFSGLIVLLVGETILILRLMLRDAQTVSHLEVRYGDAAADWGAALRASASKWGLAVSATLFAWTLQDRVAEIGAAASFILWLALNLPAWVKSDS
jgi:uncharacterized membrane protein YidH (DUF202 family)